MSLMLERFIRRSRAFTPMVELAFAQQEDPIAFMKGPGALLGHRGCIRRPADAKFMHYECELAVVSGRSAHRIPTDLALEHVAGYCIANDYTVREATPRT